MPFDPITSHRRYAVRERIRLRRSDGSVVEGLLIELSLDGCRISNLEPAELAQGECVNVEWDASELPGRVRWSRRSVAGIRLTIPLLARQLAELLTRATPQRRVAT